VAIARLAGTVEQTGRLIGMVARAFFTSTLARRMQPAKNWRERPKIETSLQRLYDGRLPDRNRSMVKLPARNTTLLPD